jgi:hypothetical protein
MQIVLLFTIMKTIIFPQFIGNYKKIMAFILKYLLILFQICYFSKQFNIKILLVIKENKYLKIVRNIISKFI